MQSFISKLTFCAIFIATLVQSQNNFIWNTNFTECSGKCVPRHLCILSSSPVRPSTRFGSDEDDGKPCRGDLICCKLDGLKPPPLECGYFNKKKFSDGDSSAMPVQSNTTHFGEYPWMIAVFTVENGTSKYIGVGSLIHPKVVLTVAHIVNGIPTSQLLLRAGEWNPRSLSRDSFKESERQVFRVIVHENYDATKLTLVNDIALVFLASEFTIEPHIQTACLPLYGENSTGRCIAAGWGQTTVNSNDMFKTSLKKVSLPIVEKTECERSFRRNRPTHEFNLAEGFICAGGEPNIDVCFADGGAPLMCEVFGQPNRLYQVGIVSWGVGCGDPIPGIYINVSYFRNWIDDKMMAEKLDLMWYNIIL